MFTDTNYLCGWVNTEISQEISPYYIHYTMRKIKVGYQDSNCHIVLMQTPAWLTEMIEHPTWRSLIYRLAEEYPDCLMLNFTIKVCCVCKLLCMKFTRIEEAVSSCILTFHLWKYWRDFYGFGVKHLHQSCQVNYILVFINPS